MDSTQADLLRESTRAHILDAATDGATAAELAAALGVPATRLYHHLEKLVAAGLLEVVGNERNQSAVAKVYRAAERPLSRVANARDVALALRDAERDAAGTDGVRSGGRTITRMTRVQAKELAAKVEALVAEVRERDEPTEGDLVGFTYVLAPVAKPRSSAVTTRPAMDSDVATIQRIVYEAISWRPEEQVPPLEQVVDHPEFARYHRDWGRPGDVGVVAEARGEVVGGAFFRTFTEEDHGHGYIDANTPEVAVAVWGMPRGRGLGSRLMDDLHAAAAESGFVRLSLSVNKDNPAVRLYQRLGYEIHSTDGGSHRMIKEL